MEPSPASTVSPLLSLRGVSKTFVTKSLFGKAVATVAARDVSFVVNRGEAVALVGESGSGKSTIAKLVLRLLQADGGEIALDGQNVLKSEPRRASLGYRARVQMVFQDPFGSLNPVHNVFHHLRRPLLRHRRCRLAEVRTRALGLLETAGLKPAIDFIDRHPDELSGGQRQRVAIARALAVEPEILIADEPTSMLDVSVRTGVLNLLDTLKRDRKLGILMITHDLASARYLCERILVLYRGRIVEEGPSNDVVGNPQHPYTRQLLAAIADAAMDETESPIEITTAESDRVSVGCPFAPRCEHAVDECWHRDPAPRDASGHQVRCHLYAPNGERPQ